MCTHINKSYETYLYMKFFITFRIISGARPASLEKVTTSCNSKIYVAERHRIGAFVVAYSVLLRLRSQAQLKHVWSCDLRMTTQDLSCPPHAETH